MGAAWEWSPSGQPCLPASEVASGAEREKQAEAGAELGVAF